MMNALKKAQSPAHRAYQEKKLCKVSFFCFFTKWERNPYSISIDIKIVGAFLDERIVHPAWSIRIRKGR